VRFCLIFKGFPLFCYLIYSIIPQIKDKVKGIAGDNTFFDKKMYKISVFFHIVKLTFSQKIDIIDLLWEIIDTHKNLKLNIAKWILKTKSNYLPVYPLWRR